MASFDLKSGPVPGAAHTDSSNMTSRYTMPSSPSSASGMCPGSPSSTRSLDDLLTCPVCLDEFKDPKTLLCLHSFCYKCLENCKRSYRRDVTCPVCKKVTPLSGFGIGGLQNDFRIQQIRDILLNRPNSPGTSVEDVNMPGSEVECKICDLCRTQQKKTSANTHCIQCYMYFCASCVEKHNSNQLFVSHHVINMTDSHASDTLFCKNHKDHPVRYFCKPCSLMMCTICTMDHDQTHAPQPLEKGIIENYRKQLHESLRMVHHKLSEVNSRSKYLETVKQSHQRSLQEAQMAIHEKTEDVIKKIRERELGLVKELKSCVDQRMRETGVENLGEINFFKNTMDSLYADIQKVIKGSPQDCLIAYDELANRTKHVSEAMLPNVAKRKKSCRVKFVPSESDVNIVLGSLQECSLSDLESSDDEVVANSPPAGSTLSSYSTLMSTSPKSQTMSRRVSSILNAISPSRKSESKKIGKVKAFSNAAEIPPGPRSPTTINADDLVASSNTEPGSVSSTISVPSPGISVPSPGMPSPVMSVPSPVMSPTSGMSMPSPGIPMTSPCLSMPSTSLSITSSSMSPPDEVSSASLVHQSVKLVFKVDQIGGWPGRVASPSSVTFLPDGNLAVSECENRLQIFDMSGHSIRIIGWGKMKPQCVVVNTQGQLVVADKKDHCVKLYDVNGDMVCMWGNGLFSSPSGIAVASNGNIIVTDLETNNVSLHNPDGTFITQFGSWGSGDYQFNNPTHVTVDAHDNIIVSDSGNSYIKVYDKNGVFLRKFSLQSSKQGLQRRPHGVTTDNVGNILIADHDNHRISLFTNDGKFLRHVMNKQDGIRYPTGVCFDKSFKYIAVVESHVGFLSKDPHHAVKLYQLV